MSQLTDVNVQSSVGMFTFYSYCMFYMKLFRCLILLLLHHLHLAVCIILRAIFLNCPDTANIWLFVLLIYLVYYYCLLLDVLHCMYTSADVERVIVLLISHDTLFWARVVYQMFGITHSQICKEFHVEIFINL